MPQDTNVLAAIQPVNLDGGEVPKLKGRVELAINTNLPEIDLLSLWVVEEELLPTPDAVIKQPFTTVRLADFQRIDVQAQINKQASRKRLGFSTLFKPGIASSTSRGAEVMPCALAR